jgi:outer membrane protein TolC
MPILKSVFMAAVLLTACLPSAWARTGVPLSLDQCIEIALERNQQMRISRLGIETAEAQLKQALSAYWPQLSFETAYTQFDEDINFIFPQETSRYTISGIAPVPMETTVTVPEKEIKVMDRDNFVSRLQITYPLYTGGLRGALQRQGRAGVDAARQALRRSELQVIYDVQRFYFGAILASRLAKVGNDALARLETTVELTEMLYKAGSASVNKRDYLRSKVFLESVRSIVTLMRSNVELAHAALANTMGYEWDQSVRLAQDRIPFEPVSLDLDRMVADAYQFNPDWKQLEAAVDAYDAKLDEEKSMHLPKIGIKGTLWRWDNQIDDSGMSTDQNEQGYAVGVGLRIPIFSGFLTTNRIRAARSRLDAMKARQILLKGGLALQVKHAFLELSHAQKVHASTADAARTAADHRDLTERAYRQELVGADDVIESQIMEALTLARAEQAGYSHAASRIRLSFLVGKQLDELLN